MFNVDETRKTLESAISNEEVCRNYFNCLKNYCSGELTAVQFQCIVRQLLTPEQIHHHNNYLLALYSKRYEPTQATCITTDEGVFDLADYTEFLQQLSNDRIPPPHLEYRTCRSELFLPDNAFVKTRIAMHAWENKLEGVGEGVTELIVYACQAFAKNILTAMVTRKQGYRIKDKLQYGFGLPVPDPFLKNSRVNEQPEMCKLPLEEAQHKLAFSYSCSKRKRSDEKLTIQLLYETLKENPQVIGLHSIHSINLLKLGLRLGE